MEISTRRYLSEADEKEALQILRDLLRHQNRVTSDDIRLAVRSVASKGGSIAIPSDFPPSRWVLKFKRVHGFIQPNSFVYGGEGSSINRIHKPGSVASRAIRGGTADEVSDNTAIVPSDKRGYKSSHTVSAETWEKAIAAVEEQGMSLRAAAKVYRVHFAALYRRVKKRAQGGQSEGMSNGYFHPSDEAGIVHVVVTRAELGVLMTFNELLALVEASDQKNSNKFQEWPFKLSRASCIIRPAAFAQIAWRWVDPAYYELEQEVGAVLDR
ncbi:hypothetical protein BBO99_00006545 [Phytophthora kernoviae]|uniref:HTH psq-type domain-containing protein n=2 Tax=Phytophthora kernoviae TaxID=325452 RepID=A0A3R7KHR6_9STRA|nr:hypothetical protein G195_008096 [Phytophthora kernoviae 00238/432]KAG2520297.1 hypothetical protein JM16_006777 [Phytophthora kernoviae]KAG2521121.1 hypothetical protein JM18_006643 [Phytophthora kernoviae]RLN13836.1 hypothetical protein BBI17_006588 [Phytophthora kernoviae]RLN77689.1 hypothetical protein BBO99_00006545 [Phytophthora kernoviae]